MFYSSFPFTLKYAYFLSVHFITPLLQVLNCCHLLLMPSLQNRDPLWSWVHLWFPYEKICHCGSSEHLRTTSKKCPLYTPRRAKQQQPNPPGLTGQSAPPA